jgi:hypothetical protein
MVAESYEEQEIEQEESEVIPLKKYTITSYGADYTVDSLVKRMREENIFVPRFSGVMSGNSSRLLAS